MPDFESFDEVLSQLVDDQSLFEAEPPEGHDELIQAGKYMIEKLEELKNLGREVFNCLSDEQVNRVLFTMQDYRDILLPPKVCGGAFASCLSCLAKYLRSGAEYEAKLLTVHSFVIEAAFSVQVMIIEHQSELINLDSLRFSEYVNSMNAIANYLEKINTKGGDQNREAARVDLLAQLEKVDRFIKRNFESETDEIRIQALRRIASTGEVLSTRQRAADGTPLAISRRHLVKAQGSLQEIMNSAADFSKRKARESLDEVDAQSALLKEARSKEVEELNALEDKMNAANLGDTLYQVREGSDAQEKDLSVRLKEATKRWKIVSSQSNVREIVQYEEEIELSLRPGEVSANAQKIFNKTTKEFTKIGQKAGRMPGNVASGGKMAALGVVGAVTGAATGVGSLATGAVKGVGGAVGGTLGALKGAMNDAATNVKQGVSGAVESVTGSGSKDKSNSSAAAGGKKEQSKGVFDHFDSFISQTEEMLDPSKVASKMATYSLLNGAEF